MSKYHRLEATTGVVLRGVSGTEPGSGGTEVKDMVCAHMLLTVLWVEKTSENCSDLCCVNPETMGI